MEGGKGSVYHLKIPWRGHRSILAQKSTNWERKQRQESLGTEKRVFGSNAGTAALRRQVLAELIDSLWLTARGSSLCARPTSPAASTGAGWAWPLATL